VTPVLWPYGEIVGEDEIDFSLMLGGELLTPLS
jgi:hypothetical protein